MTRFTVSDTFPPGTEEQWRALVERVLKGDDFTQRLVSTTAEGVEIAPLYTRKDTPPGFEHASAGTAAFTRGTMQERETSAWDIRALHADPDPKRTNRAIHQDLAGGVTSLKLQVAAPGWFGIPYDGQALEQVLDGVDLSLCSVSLRAGEYTVDAAGSLMALWRKRGLAAGQCRGCFGADPLGTLAATGALYHPLEKSLGIAARLVSDAREMPHVRPLLADGLVYHAAGATDAQELACMLATLVAYLRAGEATGLAPRDVLAKIELLLSLNADQLLGVAKLRAARQLVWRIADACGVGDAAAHIPLGVETSTRMMTKRDPWVNMLRTTMACAVGAVGGADSIAVLPYTWALGRPDDFARRMARNTQLVLMEESGLGRVADPAGGSWAVESLTRDLARTAWESFRVIEAKGGMGDAIAAGFVQDEIGRQAEAQARLIATGATPLTGTSAFALLGDDGVRVEAWPARGLSTDLKGARATPLRAERLAAPFEALRDAADVYAAANGQPPRVFLACLGPLSAHSTRSTAARNFFAAGGIDADLSDGIASPEDASRTFATSGTKVACICSSDRLYDELGDAVARALKSSGARRVLVAGHPGSSEVQRRAAGVDSFVYDGTNMIEELRAVHEALGVAAALH